jgi:glyoxylase-like metal-dependent hydrolase (beta-lactamase superfamily II)
LFIGSCGRVDLQESDPDLMDKSLSRLANFAPELVVFPGHNYAAPTSSTIAKERASNVMMRSAIMNVRGQATSSSVGVLLPDYLGAARRALMEES